jgi:hypothetical protein
MYIKITARSGKIRIRIDISKHYNKLTYELYRKPTTTDTIIHNSSCHSNEHKGAAINSLTNRHIPLTYHSFVDGIHAK